MLVAMYGYKGYDDQITADNRQDKFPLYDPTLGDHWGDLDDHAKMLEIEWDIQNMFYKMLCGIYRLESRKHSESAVFVIWRK